MMNNTITIEKAIQIAAEYGLENEVKDFIDMGYEPWEALYEWDVLPVEY